LIGAERKHYYNYFYVILIVVASVASLTTVVNIIDGSFALMAIPTMTSALILSPRVRSAARDYFKKMKHG
jgi:AGCS family alanine or glycine:cation symporter